MGPDELGAAADRNLVAAWSLIARTAGFPIERSGPVVMTASGLPLAYFNGAFAAGPAGDPASVIDAVLAFFAGQKVPFLLWVREGTDSALLGAGRAAGLVAAGGPPLLAMEPITARPALPDELDVTVAVEPADIEAHREVLAAGFGMPMDVGRRVISDTYLSERDITVFIGRVEATPVATAALIVSGDTAGVYNVATVPGNQRKGYGAALTWEVLAEGARQGCTHAVLQSSEAGYPVYRRMGFTDAGHYVQLSGPPAPR